MDRRKIYRIILILLICLDLGFMLVQGYRYLDRKIPDEIYVEKGSGQNVAGLLKCPFVEFESSIAVSGNGSYTLSGSILGVVPFKNVKVIPTDEECVMASGSTVGIYLETDGVLIIDTGTIVSETGDSQTPAADLVKPGDYIVSFNRQQVTNKRQLMEDLKQLGEAQVTLDIRRDGETIPVSISPAKDANGAYKLGIWVRDDTQGIGTLTYVDSRGKYGALGHGISDLDTGKLLNIEKGLLYHAQILGIRKGSTGSPGELSGLIRYDMDNEIGTIGINCENGIYGEYTGNQGNGIALRQMKIGYKQELQTGPASILSCVDGSVKEYQVEIEQIDLNHEDINKSFILHVTDPELLNATGGIVQGMSGSPVVQNGKLVGAVTHVFVNDPSRGYGIFIETMLKK